MCRDVSVLVLHLIGRLHGETTHDGDVVLHMFQRCFPCVEELKSWILMFLVDGYSDGMLSRTTTISGGGGCKVLG